VYRYLLFSKWS